MKQDVKKNPALRLAIKGVGGVQPLIVQLQERCGVAVTKAAVYHWLWQGSVPRLVVDAVSRVTQTPIADLNPSLKEQRNGV